MAELVHSLQKRLFVHLAEQSHQAPSHASASSVLMFIFFFTFSIIAVLLLLWFIYLRRREQELEALRLGIGGPALTMPPVPIQPSGIVSIIKKPFVDPPAFNCGDCQCQDPVLPMPPNAISFPTVQQFPGISPFPMGPPAQTMSILPNLPMPPMNVTAATLMSSGIKSSTLPGTPIEPIIIHEFPASSTPSVFHSGIQGVPPGSPIMQIAAPPFMGPMPGMPAPPHQTSLIGARPGETIISAQNINPSLSSMGIMDPIFAIQTSGGNDLQRTLELNALMSQHPMMFAEIPYHSEGPDIPLAVSRVLGPSPTAGHRVPSQMSPPSLPPHLTEAGIRASRANHLPNIGIPPQVNILGLEIINPGAPAGYPVPPGGQVLRTTKTTTETVQQPPTVVYPTLPPMRPMSPGPGFVPLPPSGMMPPLPAGGMFPPGMPHPMGWQPLRM